MKLLDKNELTRLGSKSGASEVKQHKWFSKINWGLLRNTQPPVSFVLCTIHSPHHSHPSDMANAKLSLLGGFLAEWGSIPLRGSRLAITLSATIKHVVFDVRSSVRHKGVRDDGVMVFDIRVC